jgi:hypothetical protein
MADNILVLSDLTADVDQFVQQFQAFLQTRPTWKGNLTTQTSETLVELISSVGAFAQGRIIREAEDAFAETAQSDSAIRSITSMQGLRMARYLPAGIPVTLTTPADISLPPLTQFSCAGNYFFNREELSLQANTDNNVTLYEGKVYSYQMNGLGTERQTFVSSQDSFVISDRDVIVQINGTMIPKAYGGLWAFDGLPGYADLTMSDGRLLIQFGNYGGNNAQFGAIPQFGSIPGVNDTVIITYPVSKGASGNNILTNGKPVTVTGFPLIVGTATSNPTGGANDNPVIAYKNIASGGFGTYQSAVTKSQYLATLATYPGIVDVITQAQREIDPSDYRWMNVIRVAALTASPWLPDQIQEFLDYFQKVTMYSTYPLWVEPIPILRTVELNVYIFNSAVPTQVQANVVKAIQTMFSARPGILMTNFYESDLIEAAFRSSPGLISYVEVAQPGGPMIVTAPESPIPHAEIHDGGSLAAGVYAYGISTTLDTGETGTPVNWIFPNVTDVRNVASITLTWPKVWNASTYTIWGRQAGIDQTTHQSKIGKLIDVPATQNTWTDDGSITPTGQLDSSLAKVPIRYNKLQGDPIVNVYFAERQQRFDSQDPSRLSNG